MPDQPLPPLVLMAEVDDLDALKAFLKQTFGANLPPDKAAMLDSLHRTSDGGLAVKAFGVTVRVTGFIGPAG